ncbi:MAG TPA: hypothetical protein VFG30_25215 [Polyangiales bacterium]|nr:hypothetical protein [Polyangiales bacterium]
MTRTGTASRRAPSSNPLIACLLLICASLAGSARAQIPVATRVDGVAAAIGGTAGESADVILQSDVELRARLLLLGRDEKSALHLELPTGLLSAALRELIGEKLIAREAERVQITRPTQAMVAQEKQRLVASAGGPDRVQRLLASLGAGPAELDGMAERRALVGAFLRANLEGTTLITEREIDQQIARDGAQYAGQNPVTVRAQVRTILARATLARNIERWVRVLRARVPVRIYASFESS